MTEIHVTAWELSSFDGCFPSKNPVSQMTSVSLECNAMAVTLHLDDSHAQTLGSAVLAEQQDLAGVTFAAGSRLVVEDCFDSNSHVRFLLARLVNADPKCGANEISLVFSSVELTPGTVYPVSNTGSDNQIGDACFTRGTGIAAPHGEIPIEDLEEGDEVLTRHGGTQVISKVVRHRFSAIELVLDYQLRPVTIQADAISAGLPGHELSVSQKHRMLLNDWRAPYLFGEEEILVPAKSLLNGVTVLVTTPKSGVEYFQIYLDGHDLISANGLWAETSLPSFDAVNDETDEDAQSRISDNNDYLSNVYQTILPSLVHDSALTLVA